MEIADALDNNFPWALHDQTGEMPLRTKKQVVEKYLEGRRLTEEKVLLEKRDDWIFEVLQGHCYSKNLINN